MLLNRGSFMKKYPSFAEGMDVFGKDGQKLGKVLSTGDNAFVVEKGVFFPKDFSLRFDDISEIRDNKIFLRQSTNELKEWKEPEYAGWTKVEAVNVGLIEAKPTESYKPKYESLSEETIKVPLMEEELEATKTSRQTGELRVRKIVHTELRHITVPLAHEEVRVERVKIDRYREPEAGESREAFQEKTISMPVMDEEVVLSKHAKVREEVRLTKERRTEQRDVSDQVRKEDLEIDDKTATGAGKKKAG